MRSHSDLVSFNGVWQSNTVLREWFLKASTFHDVIPDWIGNLWFVTGGAYLGYREQSTGEFYTYQLPAEGETIQNSFAVDDEGLYVVSTGRPLSVPNRRTDETTRLHVARGL